MDVSVLTMTHGRNWMLPEAVESFVRQRDAFDGSCEMVIYNDMPEQTIVCDVEGVRVVNIEKRFDSHNEKTDWGVIECKGKYICVQDDDDIFLPHRLQMQYNTLVSTKARMVHMPWAYFTHLQGTNWEIEALTGASLFWCGAMFERYLYFDAGGCRHATDHNDQAAMRRMREICGKEEWIHHPPKVYDEDTAYDFAWAHCFYLYRWGGVCAHLSAQIDKDKSEVSFAERVRRDPRFVEGEVVIKPRWHQDYEDTIDKWRTHNAH